MAGHKAWIACVAISALIPSLARAAPSCAKILTMFPQPGRADPTQTGNAFRPLPILVGPNGVRMTMDAVRFGLPTSSGINPPGPTAWVGNYQVEDVPAFAIAPGNGTAATLSQTGLEDGNPVPVPQSCLSDPALIYGGTHWSLKQGQTIHVTLGSKLDYVGPYMVNLPYNGAAPCRSVNLHTHGLLVSPYAPRRPGEGEYGDYVLDVTLAPHSAAGSTDDCQAAIGQHVHGVTPKPLQHEIQIPGMPGTSTMDEGQHPSGLFWYHPHTHGYSRGQVSGGTTGVITVGKLGDYACTEQSPPPTSGQCPAGTGATGSRIIALKDAQILPVNGGLSPFRLRPDYDAGMCNSVPAKDETRPGECMAADGSGGRWVFTVNGVQYPTIIEPGSKQDEIWRIANTSPNVSYRLTVVPQANAPDAGREPLPFQVIAIDGVSIPQSPGGDGQGIYQTSEILMMPGTRAEVRVTAPTNGGTYVLRNQVVSTAANGTADTWPQMDLMQVTWPAPPANVALAPMATQARPAGLSVLGPQRAEAATVMAMQRAAGATPKLPAGCTVSSNEERVIYFVHRTRTRADGGSQEVFGILAGIRQQGAKEMRFFDKDFNEVPGLKGVADVWKAIVDPNDPNNAAPAFDTSPYGNICAVKDGHSERWVIENWTGEDHNFHLHQSRFTLDTAHLTDSSGTYFQFPTGTGRDKQVLATDGLIQAIVAQSSTAPSWTAAHHDSVPVPRGEGLCPNDAADQICKDSNGKPIVDSNGNPIGVADRECSGDPTDGTCTRLGIVSINVTFGRTTQVGKFVYHCHILEHEDLGMMARVQVICPDGGTSCGGGAEQQAQAGNAGHHH